MQNMENLSAVQKLYRIVEDTELCNAYEEYLVKHFAWENFGFWFEVENYKLEEDVEEQKRLAQLIYSKFLDVGCIFELGDLEPSMREVLHKKIQNPTKTMFNLLQRRVMSSLALGTIADFFEDDIYKVFEACRPQAPAEPAEVFVNRKPRDRSGTIRVSGDAVPTELKKQASMLPPDTMAKGFLFNYV